MDTNCSRHTTQWVAALTVVVSIGCLQKPEERLGEQIFNDQNLSTNKNQSCASCHSLDTGGVGPDSDLNLHGAVYEGSVSGRFGNRKPPATVYATLAPRFSHMANVGFVGGNFWDGRATGWELGNPAADQAKGPFLNPIEQALPSATELVAHVCESNYGKLFRQVNDQRACKDANAGYSAIARSVAAFEGSLVVSPFSSKYDASRLTTKVNLDERETLGLALFKGKGGCAKCHVMDSEQQPPLFTDFTFDNLGIPANPENPFYRMDQVIVNGAPVNPQGAAWVDIGLAGFLEELVKDSAWRALPYVTQEMVAMPSEGIASLVAESRGKHRVPTVRDVDKRPYPSFVKAYGHNGYFKSLKGIVHFYNTRDVLSPCAGHLTEAEALRANCWPAPEVEENVNRSELGNLGLSNDEEDAMVAFLATLSDGWATNEMDPSKAARP